ncbi:MAG TPA: ROK family protein [Chloroflexota bacterium]|nr:ROK family protein [Chloroflexota bacterium]
MVLHEALSEDHVEELAQLLALIRRGSAVTRSELVQSSGFGRTAIARRLDHLMALGLIAESEPLPSTGGRMPRGVYFRADAGRLLVAELGATSIAAGICDLDCRVLSSREEAWDIAAGPEPTLVRLEALLSELLQDHQTTVWGIGVGLPGPIEFATGRPVSPPIMPGWDRYPVRERLAKRFSAPVWVDNDVNVLALGELRAGVGRAHSDLIYIKIGTGIGAGIVSGGRLHRGAQGCAGDIGHVAVTDDQAVVCRCGNIGCLEAVAGGAALARRATAWAREGRSSYLQQRLTEGGDLTAATIAAGAAAGDTGCVELLTAAARQIGDSLATFVNFFNPSIVIIGGGVAQAGNAFLASIRQRVYSRSLPLATRDLQIVLSSLGDIGGLIGAAHMVVDEILSPKVLSLWIKEGTPEALARAHAGN